MDFIYRYSLTALRIALGLVFIWFGALKVGDATPVAALVEGTTPWSDPGWFVPALGAFEVGLGAWLVVGRGLKLAVPVMVAHLAGTFGVLALTPEVAFQHGNPLLLTTEGEFVAKNLVLITAALAIGATTRTRTNAPGLAGARGGHAALQLAAAGGRPSRDARGHGARSAREA